MTTLIQSALLLLVSATPSQDEPIDAKLRRLLAEVDASRIEATVRDLVGFGTRHVLSATRDRSHGTGAARDYLQAKLESYVDGANGRLSVARESYEVDCRRRGMPAKVPVVNIVATLRGTSDPDRIYVVGGHYDSINSRGSDGDGVAPGANDDGSGTAVAVEACRVLSRHEFPATILFVCYDGEEQGLLGSKAHAAALAAADADVDGMITNDIVGNTLGMDGVRRRGYVRCFSYAPRGNDSGGRSLARVATRAARFQDAFEVKLVFRGDRYGRGGDHRSFFDQGYPSVRFTEPREDYSRQHRNVTERDGQPYGDLPDFMDFDYVAEVARLNVATLAELASAPRSTPRVRIRGARDAHDVNVSWTPVDGAAAWEIVWRDTTAADWQHARRVEPEGARNALTTVLNDVCIDDVVIGVRALAEDGSRGRVGTPPEPDAMAYRRQAMRAGRERR